MNIAIDFDHTIHDAGNPIKGRRMGGPIFGAKEALDKLKHKYNIIVFCYWANSPQSIKTISDWMNFYNCPFNQITNIKPDAKYFIDDRAVKFTNWTNVLQEVL